MKETEGNKTDDQNVPETPKAPLPGNQPPIQKLPVLTGNLFIQFNDDAPQEISKLFDFAAVNITLQSKKPVDDDRRANLEIPQNISELVATDNTTGNKFKLFIKNI